MRIQSILILTMVLLAGCSRNGANDTARIAILPFENLSGDNSLERFVLPAQAIVQNMIGSRIPGASEGVAILNGATAVAHGVMQRTAQGRIRLSIDVMSTATHKLLQSYLAEGSDPLEAAGKLASTINPAAKPLAQKSPQTMELWTTILNGGPAPVMREACKRLVESDPLFSPAYASCFNVFFATFSKPELQELGEQVYANRDQLSLEAQNLGGQILFQTGRFEHAAELLRRGATQFPTSWNQVGYSEAVMGHAELSKKALEEYRKLGGDESNAVDSMGEAAFILNQYAEAEKYFLEVAEKFPQSVPGRAAKIKAAAMRAMRGDRTGAEELARNFLDPLRKSGQDVKQIEEAWREVILEQDPKVMREKIGKTIIGVPSRE